MQTRKRVVQAVVQTASKRARRTSQRAKNADQQEADAAAAAGAAAGAVGREGGEAQGGQGDEAGAGVGAEGEGTLRRAEELVARFPALSHLAASHSAFLQLFEAHGAPPFLSQAGQGDGENQAESEAQGEEKAAEDPAEAKPKDEAQESEGEAKDNKGRDKAERKGCLRQSKRTQGKPGQGENAGTPSTPSQVTVAGEGEGEQPGTQQQEDALAACAAHTALCRTIVYQQLAGKAARTIWGKVVVACQGNVSPGSVLDAGVGKLRTAGLSERKASYLVDLSQHFATSRLRQDQMHTLPPDELRTRLLRVKGVGPWSVDMFFMFSLGHLDVFPVGDLGVRKGMAKFLGLDVKKLKDKAMEEAAAPWAPYRSVASWYMWRVADTTPM